MVSLEKLEEEEALVMKQTTSLCFTREGLLNPGALSYVNKNQIKTLLFVSDGSEEAFDHIAKFDFSQIDHTVDSVGVNIPPLYEARVTHHDGRVSDPHYLYSEDTRAKWLCSNVCVHFIDVSISDTSSQSGTQTKLPPEQVQVICYLAYTLWKALKTAEDRLHFPAVVIDKMTRWTYQLTPETIDIPVLRKEIGIESLNYNHLTDLLTLSVGGEEYFVKLSVLDAFYGSHILPIFNSIYGRRLRIVVEILGSDDRVCKPTDMTYGQLGRLVEEMEEFTKIRSIGNENTIAGPDLLAFARELNVNDESCIWVPSGTLLKDFVEENTAKFTRASE